MLEYRINKNKLKDDRFHFEFVENSDVTGLIEPVTENYEDKLIMRCDCLDIDKINKGSIVEVVTELNMNYGDSYGLSNHYNFFNEFVVDSFNKENNIFSFVIDKFVDVDVNHYLLTNVYVSLGECNSVHLRKGQKYINCDDEETVAEVEGNYNAKSYGDEYLFVYCNTKHFFDLNDEQCTLYIKFFDREDYVWEYLYEGEEYTDEYGEPQTAEANDFYYITNKNKNSFSILPVDFEYFSPDALKVKIYDENGEFTGHYIERVYNAITNELVESLNYPIYPSYVTAQRKTFLFGGNTVYDVYYNKPQTSIDIPLANVFETNMYQSDLLKENYVDVEKSKVINKVIDMEKQIYHPFFVYDGNMESIYKIVFNLHFRKHRGETWVCKQSDYWNGVYIDSNDNKAKFIPDFFSYTEKERQSDLMTYLGFTNNDVRYQKSKIKKSFLRLMFYDSPNPTKQNLISYSTIYVDSNNIFTKFVKNLKDGKYVMIKESDEDTNIYNVVENLNGIRVDRETVEEDNENLRLSCQLTVNDRNNNTTSCDGFYFYSWKNDEIGTEEQTAYLKIEFNHAGFGRVLPMMMPYWDNKKHPIKKGIKTFEEILNDWNESRDKNQSDGKYGMSIYNKFSYIKVKYRYSNKLQKYIYYLDEEVYGNIATTKNYENNQLIINLFEAKVEV